MDDSMQCELCDAKHPTDDMIRHGDVILCPKCSAEVNAAFHACAHVWEPDTDECGEPAQVCRKCGGFVPDEDVERIIGTPRLSRKPVQGSFGVFGGIDDPDALAALDKAWSANQK